MNKLLFGKYGPGANALYVDWPILVRYRTNSGYNAKLVTVKAKSQAEALQSASDKVRRMRGVIGIDSIEWRGISDDI